MKEKTNKCVKWVKNYLDAYGIQKVVIGISGGKDSSICAAICAKAIGNKNVYGVMMPNGTQKDISDSRKIIDFLKINSQEINIHPIYDKILESIDSPSERTKINVPPRIRSVVLYAIAQSLGSAFVCNTSNLDEKLVGYSTIWGDSIGDFSPIGNLHVSEVLEIGKDLGLPEELVFKTPDDGLSGKTDEENLGFKYSEVEELSKDITHAVISKSKTMFLPWCDILEEIQKTYPDFIMTDVKRRIAKIHNKNLFKSEMIHIPAFVPDFRFER